MTKEATARRPPRPVPAETATRRKVIDAAVACILDRGFYRASSNEIARRAGVTWGVIQHHFGTREALMVAVLEDGSEHFTELVRDRHLGGKTVADRMDELVDLLFSHYGQPEYLVYLQILLNLDRDPKTGPEVRRTMREVAKRTYEHVNRLLREALGPATRVPDLQSALFLAIRGFFISQQLLGSMAYDAPSPRASRLAHQRRLLAEMLTPYVELASSARL